MLKTKEGRRVYFKVLNKDVLENMVDEIKAFRIKIGLGGNPLTQDVRTMAGEIYKENRQIKKEKFLYFYVEDGNLNSDYVVPDDYEYYMIRPEDFGVTRIYKLKE